MAWFGQNARDLPWRRTSDPYAIWVSEIMLQQTQVKTVLPYWERWMKALPNVESLAKASPQKIHKLWEGLGYYARGRNLQRAAQTIVNEHGGRFPTEFDAVLALPGVGRYTAGAICSIAFNQPTPILDGNVIRLLTRLCGIKGDPREKKTNAKLWQIAEALVRSVQNKFGSSRRKQNPNSWREQHETNEQREAYVRPDRKWQRTAALSGRRGTAATDCKPVLPRSLGVRLSSAALPSVHWQAQFALSPKAQSLLTSAATTHNNCSHLNQSLMELGALICTPKNPRCSECPLKTNCVAHRKGIVHLLPNIPRRAPAISRRFFAFVIKRNSSYLVRQRPAGVVNAHLWEFPNTEINGESDPIKIAKHALGHLPVSLVQIRTIRHTITRYRITLDVFQGEANGRVSRLSGRWLTPHQLTKLPFSSAHKRILTSI